MPHFGEQAALVGTLRRDGITARIDNALRTTNSSVTWLFEDGEAILFEDGETMVTE